MKPALDALVQTGLCQLEEHHRVHFSQGKFALTELRLGLQNFFWNSEKNEEEQVAFLQSVILFFAAVFPREPSKLVRWRLSRGLEKPIEAAMMRIWNDWRQKAPVLITEDFAICVCSLAAHSVAVDKPLVFAWCLQVAKAIQLEYPDAFTTMVKILYSFADADYCFTLQEDRWSVRTFSRKKIRRPLPLPTPPPSPRAHPGFFSYRFLFVRWLLLKIGTREDAEGDGAS